jgi:hypothetical protein
LNIVRGNAFRVGETGRDYPTPVVPRRVRGRTVITDACAGWQVQDGAVSVIFLVPAIFLLDAEIDFLPVYFDLEGSVHTDAYLPALNAEYGDSHIVTDHDGFANTSC